MSAGTRKRSISRALLSFERSLQSRLQHRQDHSVDHVFRRAAKAQIPAGLDQALEDRPVERVSARLKPGFTCGRKGRLRADLRGVTFSGCHLGDVQMSFAKLAGADFRGAELQGLRVRIEDLKGAIVEPIQAAYLSGLMGLKIIP